MAICSIPSSLVLDASSDKLFGKIAFTKENPGRKKTNNKPNTFFT